MSASSSGGGGDCSSFTCCGDSFISSPFCISFPHNRRDVANVLLILFTFFNVLVLGARSNLPTTPAGAAATATATAPATAAATATATAAATALEVVVFVISDTRLEKGCAELVLCGFQKSEQLRARSCFEFLVITNCQEVDSRGEA